MGVPAPFPFLSVCSTIKSWVEAAKSDRTWLLCRWPPCVGNDPSHLGPEEDQ